MKKTKITFLIGTVSSLLILIYLYYNFSTSNARANYLKNGGFVRNTIAVNLSPWLENSLNNGQYALVGIVDEKIIVREYDKGNLILLSSGQTKSNINIPSVIKPKNIFSISLNPFEKNVVDIQCNNDNRIFEFNIEKQKIDYIYEFGHYFYKAIRASKNSFYALMQIDSMKAGLVLVQFGTNGKMRITKRGRLVIDAMREDGTLIKTGSDLLYINFYNNNISTIDSTLNTINNYKTIDTITELPKTININNNTITKFVNQPRPVNQLVRVTKEFLFVNSYVKADNDNKNNPGNMETFDVYDIKKKYRYRGTFYLKKYDNNRIQDFLIQDDKLILQYPNKTLSYGFSF